MPCQDGREDVAQLAESLFSCLTSRVDPQHDLTRCGGIHLQSKNSGIWAGGSEVLSAKEAEEFKSSLGYIV